MYLTEIKNEMNYDDVITVILTEKELPIEITNKLEKEIRKFKEQKQEWDDDEIDFICNCILSENDIIRHNMGHEIIWV